MLNLTFVFVLLVLICSNAEALLRKTVELMPFLDQPTQIVPDHFLSFTLDYNQGEAQWDGADITRIDLNNQRLATWVRSLSPAILRIGGSQADYATYKVQGVSYCDEGWCLTMDRWEEIVQFCEINGCKVVFDLNIGYGRCNGRPDVKKYPPPFYCKDSAIGKWDPTNTIALLEYTAKHNLKVYGFELGNEKTFVLSPQEAADCYRLVGETLKKLWSDPKSRPKLLGPATNINSAWITEFLNYLGPNVLDVVTYHAYIGYGSSPTVQEKLLDPAFLDQTERVASSTLNAARSSKHWDPNTQQVWLGEGAAAWASGKSGVCNAMYSTLWYLDTLGTLSRVGVSAFCRQCLSGGGYALLDQTKHFFPNPDAWMALLWRNLMGQKVLSMPQLIPQLHDFSPKFRGYMHCHPKNDGSVTLAYSNLEDDVEYALAFMKELRNPMIEDFGSYQQYELTSPQEGKRGLGSRTVQLNGKILQMPSGQLKPNDNVSFPISPTKTGTVIVKPLSAGFIVFPDIRAKACATQV